LWQYLEVFSLFTESFINHTISTQDLNRSDRASKKERRKFLLWFESEMFPEDSCVKGLADDGLWEVIGPEGFDLITGLIRWMDL
jgi:hypothetical protein